MTELGLKRGDRVLVILPRVVPWWETLVGLFKAGIVAIPGTTLLTAKDIAYRLDLAQAAAVITDPRGPRKSTPSPLRRRTCGTACWSPTKIAPAGTALTT